MARAKRRRLAQAPQQLAGLRNLTETERQILIRRLTPHMVAEQQAKALINATLDTFLATLGFPANVNVDMATGAVSFLEGQPAAAPQAPPTPAPNGAVKEVPAA